MSLTLATAWPFLLVLLRTAGLAISLPTFGSRQIPGRVRLGLTFALAVVLYQGAGAPLLPPPPSLGALIAASLAETVLGLCGGLAARFTLEAAAAAGGMVSTATGLSYGAMVDPMNGAESNALGQLLRLLSLAFALEAGLHREALLWLAGTLRAAPLGAPSGLHDALARALVQATYCSTLAVRIAFPVLALVGLSYIALGLVSRIVPQLGLPNLGFSIAVLVGGGALYAVAPEAAHRVGELAAQSLSAP